MGKQTKSARSQRRKAKKRAERDARRARYKSFAEEGKKKGSRRQRAKSKSLVGGPDHPKGACGNPACFRCYPREFNLPRSLRIMVAQGWFPVEEAVGIR